MSKLARCRLIRAIHRLLRQSADLAVSRRRSGAVWKIFEFHRVVRLAARARKLWALWHLLQNYLL